ncbi:hypothetical protein B566_EDAN003318 [Ephemera danica]|nr:hypothetical protein B566_EDAN003318 [Ephemera danica]
MCASSGTLAFRVEFLRLGDWVENPAIGLRIAAERGMVVVTKIASKQTKAISSFIFGLFVPTIRIRRMDNVNLTDNFLIAMPALEDHYFSNALVYICEHNENGALGIIVNRPIDLDLAGLLEKIDIKLENNQLSSLPVYFGGPVQLDRGFVLHRPVGAWQSTLVINEEVGLTSSRDVLASVGRAGQPSEIIVTLGYAGWDSGQLESELAQNSWLTVPAEPDILFDLPPEERLHAAMLKLGISFAQLSDVAGHA